MIRSHMNLANQTSQVTSLIEQFWCRFNVVKTLKVGLPARKTPLPVFVGVKAGVYYTSATTTRCRASEGFVEASSGRSQGIQMWCMRISRAVASHVLAHVVCYHEQNVSVFAHCDFCWKFYQRSLIEMRLGNKSGSEVWIGFWPRFSWKQHKTPLPGSHYVFTMRSAGILIAIC